MATSAEIYAALDEAYSNAINSIAQKKAAGELQNQQNQQTLQQNLAETNRGNSITYKNAINPFGYNAEQRGVMGSGVSDYYKNAALGTMMQGQAQAQQTYQSGLNDLNTNWRSFLLDLAGQETTAQNTKTAGYQSQQQADEQAAQAAAALAEQQRQYNASLAEQQRQYDETMSFNQRQYADSLAAAAARISSSRGGVVLEPELTGSSGTVHGVHGDDYNTGYTGFTGSGKTSDWLKYTKGSTKRGWVEHGGAQGQANTNYTTRKNVQ